MTWYRFISRSILMVVVLLSTVGSAWGEQRFPPPDFETEYVYPVHADPPVRAVALGYIDLGVLLMTLSLAAYFALKSRSRKGMAWLSLFSLLYFGFYRLGCVCAIGAIQNVALALVDPAYGIPLVVLGFFLLPLVFAMFFGRVFCAGVCPLGAIQDLVLIRPKRLPRWLEQGLGVLPYFYLGFAVFFAVTGTRFLICEYDPFVGIFRLDGPFGVMLFGVGLLVLGTVVGRPYCRFLCPYSVLLRHLSRLSNRHLTITPTDCIQCRLCAEECPFGAIDEPNGHAPSSGTVRKQVALALITVPVLTLLFGWVITRMSGHFVSWHPLAAVAREILADPAQVAGLPEDLVTDLTLLGSRFRVLGWWLGAFLALVISGRLIRISLFRVRTDYEVDRAGCVSCVRCVDVCPKDWEARGLEFPAAFAHVADMISTDPASRPRVAAPAPAPAGPPARRPWYWFGLGEGVLTRRMAWVSGIGLVLVLLILAWNQLQSAVRDPLLDQRLETLRLELAKSGDREAFQGEIRRIDREIRGGHFHRLTVEDWGGWLAIGLAVVFVTSLKVLSKAEPRLPMPQATTPDEVEARQAGMLLWSRRALLVGAGAFFLVAATWGMIRPEQLLPDPVLASVEESQQAEAEEIAVALPPPTPAEYKANWYRFRGPDGAGRAPFDPGPGAWVERLTTVWHQEIDLPGFNSPVIWDKALFVASADAEVREVYAFDRISGDKLWTCVCPFVEPDAEQAELSAETGYAPCTMVTDGRRVYVIFPNADVFGIAADSGRIVWSKALGLPENHYGHATSLEMADRLLFVQLDQGMSDDELSALYALDGATGDEVYRVARPVDASWTSPTLFRAIEPAQLVLTATPYVIAYNPMDGKEIWRADCVEGELAPSQIYAGGFVFTISPYMEMTAVRPDGSGDVSDTHIAWIGDYGVPDITSPVASEELYWTVTTEGTVTCYEIATGEELWQHETDLEFYASPSLVGGQLFLVSSEGLIVNVEAGRDFTAAGEFDLEERVMASPAFQGGMIYIRTARGLLCMQVPDGQGAADGEARP